jgi:hypothetical protein
MKGVLGLGYSILIRVFMPGAAFTLIFSPLAYSIALKLSGKISSLSKLKPGSFGDMAALFAIASLLSGGMLSLFDNYIYKIYEGIWFWPQRIKDVGEVFLKRRLKTWQDRMKKLKYGEPRYQKLRKKVDDFPLNEEGMPTVTLPTRLGNIIYEYEEYTWTRYRVVSPFYWYRLRLAVEADKKKEMDQVSAEADSMLYISFTFAFASFIYICLWISSFWIPPRLLLKSIFGIGFFSTWGFIYPTVGFILAYGLYRAALPIHRRNGEYYKSIFDTYGHLLRGEELGAPIVEMDPQLWNNLERRYWYLRRLLIKCEKCGNEFVPPKPLRNLLCSYCGDYPFKKKGDVRAERA